MVDLERRQLCWQRGGLRRQIQDELIGRYDAEVQLRFLSTYETELEDFLREMVLAFSKFRELDAFITGDQYTKIVTAYAYGSLQHHLLSTKLLIHGYLIPSGNAERYVLECIATAILAAKIGRAHV